MPFPRLSVAPFNASPVQRKNFLNVQVDAIAIGLVNAASPFLPVFLTRLGASEIEIGLLTALPGITGLVLSMIIGGFLQSRRNIVPWFSLSRLFVISAYAATGVAGFVFNGQQLIQVVLIIWAVATIPQTALAVAFSVVMNAVAGPNHRFELMSRRWSILGITTAITVALVGHFLVKMDFPINYQVVFIALSFGGLISYLVSSRIVLPDQLIVSYVQGLSFVQRLRNNLALVSGQNEFIRFTAKRFVYIFGTLLASPLFPLYFVKEVHANDAAIGLISTAQTAVLTIGYFLWTLQSRQRGSRFVLIAATLGLGLYPALVAASRQVEVIVILAGLAGIFQAGLDLVFFDELMKTIPVEYSATFVSLAQSLQYIAAILAPLLGTWLSIHIGLGSALLVSAAIRLTGSALFVFWNPRNGNPD